MTDSWRVPQPDGKVWLKISDDFLLESLRRHWAVHEFEPNYIDMIASHCGWLPLREGESMTVHYAGKEYRITRQPYDRNEEEDVRPRSWWQRFLDWSE